MGVTVIGRNLAAVVQLHIEQLRLCVVDHRQRFHLQPGRHHHPHR
jgi:hypothetical protein